MSSQHEVQVLPEVEGGAEEEPLPGLRVQSLQVRPLLVISSSRCGIPLVPVGGHNIAAWLEL
jgi:hypothetical protein